MWENEVAGTASVHVAKVTETEIHSPCHQKLTPHPMLYPLQYCLGRKPPRKSTSNVKRGTGGTGLKRDS